MMSLFPAYAEQSKIDIKSDDGEKNWLENSSFQVDEDLLRNIRSNEIEITCTSDRILETGPSDISDITQVERKRKKHKKKTVKRRRESSLTEQKYDDVIQLKGHRELLNVNKIARPAAPIYIVTYKLSKFYAIPKKRKLKRYFARPIDKKLNQCKSEDEIVTKKSLEESAVPKDNYFTGFKQEEELSQKTGYYNRYLAENPSDINVWQNYIDFQDTMYQFEKTYRKGSIAKAQRVLAERKLCIIDKALSLNPNCEQLHRERLKISVAAFPADELQTQLKVLVEKDKDNIILWQGYIEATQCSMSHCNTPAVISLYTKCLSTLHQLRRGTTVEKYIFEESILRMLYQCGLFLKQAGLFEQLWVLLKMYLELNLSPNDNTIFSISSTFNEKQLFELEEVIFTSQLPLHELWLRSEKLRESCHWMPCSGETECEDPQRIVFADDVAELIHPITTSENIFKLAATIMSLLKIPLLPCRHATMQDLGLDYVPWSLDSIETLLAVYLPMYPVDVTDKNLLDSSRLAVGPQYLKLIPGSNEYLQFILKIMQNCASCLAGDDKVSIMVWLFRFQRLLIILDNLELLKLPDNFKKGIKKNIKEFLKLPDNRQNELYYLEYALIEFHQGNTESCFSIINAALSLNTKDKIVVQSWSRAQAARCYLYKNLVHLTLTGNNECKAILYLCELPLHEKLSEQTPLVIKRAEVKYNAITTEMLTYALTKTKLVHHFHPDFFTDWLMCHAWFLYLTRSPSDGIKFLGDIIIALEEKNKEPLWQKEVLYEFYVAILFKHSIDTPASGHFRSLDEVLHKALSFYPNNLFLLSVLTKEQSLVRSLGPQWWKVQDLLLRSGRALSTLFAIIILNQQIRYLQVAVTDTVTGEHYEIDNSLKNRMISLFKKITNSRALTRRCGLIWRLYLQFVYSYCSPDMCRNVYYSAVEECPWLKALYIDAAIYIPTELPQIQDLIIEKQLRLHVTPEELEALRS